jgi:glutamate formiminotransferase / formiminotetrahydrofolate cyclodeaminase
MRRLIECVPNFSEGRDPAKINEIARAVTSIPGVMLLDTHSDADHHRSVLTFAGEPEAVLEAAFLSARKAVDLIDLNEHHGEHPRIGAIDVLPFIPLEGVTMSECVNLARRAGERIARELHIPVYLYEKAAERPEYRNLAHVRRGQFEGLRREILIDPARHPDFGEPRLHPSAGAVAVGARKILVAFNINLATDDLEVARNIAKAVRGRDGGLRYVKALAFLLHDRRQTQVSMNLVDVEKTPISRAYELVEREAERYGVNICGSEIVGLVPQAALNACSARYLRLESFHSDLVLESRLNQARNLSEDGPDPSSPAPDRYIDDVARGASVPGGGSVVALAGTLAAALGSMTCQLALSSRDAGAAEGEVHELLEELDDLRAELRQDIDSDSESFTRVIEARNRPDGTNAERLQRTAAIEQAIKGATAVLIRVAETSLAVLELLDNLAEVTKPERLSELGVGAQMALAAIRGAGYTILANLSALGDEESTRQTNRDLDDLINRGQEIADEIEALLRSKV